MCVYIYIYICIYTRVCVCIYIYIYIMCVYVYIVSSMAASSKQPASSSSQQQSAASSQQAAPASKGLCSNPHSSVLGPHLLDNGRSGDYVDHAGCLEYKFSLVRICGLSDRLTGCLEAPWLGAEWEQNDSQRAERQPKPWRMKQCICHGVMVNKCTSVYVYVYILVWA